MARHTRPILTGPLHRRDRRTWWRRCTCGLRWRCPDAGQVPPSAEPVPTRAGDQGPAWNGPTIVMTNARRAAGGGTNSGRAGLLTLAGEWCGNGGRWSR